MLCPRSLKKTEGYPYFLQEWGAHSWNAAPESPVTREHVVSAGEMAVAALDASFFRVRFDRLTQESRITSERWRSSALVHTAQGR